MASHVSYVVAPVMVAFSSYEPSAFISTSVLSSVIEAFDSAKEGIIAIEAIIATAKISATNFFIFYLLIFCGIL